MVVGWKSVRTIAAKRVIMKKRGRNAEVERKKARYELFCALPLRGEDNRVDIASVDG